MLLLILFSLSLSFSFCCWWLKLLIGRAEDVYAGENLLRGLLTEGYFLKWGFFPRATRSSPVDYPVAKKEA